MPDGAPDSLANGRYLAVLDRFEPLANGTELAVFVVETDGEPLAQLELPRETVPSDGCHADGVFELVLADDRFELRYRSEESESRRESARSRFDRLARRPPSVQNPENAEGPESEDAENTEGAEPEDAEDARSSSHEE